MAKLGSLYISLIADTAQFSSGLNKAKGDLNSTSAAINRGLSAIDKQFSGLGHSIKDMGREVFSLKGAFTSLVGVIGIGSIAEMAKRAVEAVGSLGEMADQIGVTTDTLQTFRYAASQVGVSQDEMDASLTKLTKTIGLAATGNKAAIDSFERFGIKVLDAQGKVRPTDDVIRDIAETMKSLPDPAQRAALATELMGKAGQKMVPFLQDGARGIGELVEKAKEMGLVFDRETINQADRAADSLATLGTVLTTKLQSALVQLAPYLTDFANTLIKVIDKTHDFINFNAGQLLTNSLDDLHSAQQQFAADQAEFARDPENAYNVYGISQESLRKAEADIKQQILAIQAYAEKYGLTDFPGLPSSGGKHGRVATSAAAGATTGASNPLATSTGKTEAEKNIDKLQDKLRDLQAQLLDLGAAGGADAGLNAILSGFDLSTASAQKLAGQIKAVVEQINAKKAAQTEDARQVAEYDKIIEDATQRANKTQADAKDLVESLRTPTETYTDRLAELTQMLKDGTISHETFNRAVASAKTTLNDAEGATAAWSNTMTELGSTFSSAFDEAALSGKSLSEVLQGLLQDLERLALRMAEGGIADGLFGKTGGSGGLFGGFMNWFSGLFSSGVVSGNDLIAYGVGHTGAVIGKSGGSRRMPMMANLPRFHGGGQLGADEVPFIGKKGELVGWPAQMAAAFGGGGGTTVINSSVTVNAAGGTKEQNADLASQASQAVKAALKQAINDQTRDNLRKGNLLNPSISV